MKRRFSRRSEAGIGYRCPLECILFIAAGVSVARLWGVVVSISRMSRIGMLCTAS